ncbi:S-layer protein [Oscillatoriales cyanobacterium USR001]|nr:S-layer protein [Oscillatoriales cyanobacterium USR001]
MRSITTKSILRIKYFAGNASLSFLLLISLTACANSPNSKALEESLAADPRLNEKPVNLSTPTPSPVANESNISTAKLPGNFPAEIPIYTNAQLLEVTESNNSGEAKILRWKTTDPSNYIQNFYQTELTRKKWEIINKFSEDGQGKLTATKDNLQVVVSFVSPQKSAAVTEFLIEYGKGAETIIATPQPSNSPILISPTPSPSFSPSPNLKQGISTPLPIPQKTVENQNEVPQELRQYVSDVAQLGVLKLQSKNQGLDSNNSNNTLPEPNKIITRREYSRWLVAANNQIYANNQGKQIRLAVNSNAAIFSDVPKSDPDFPAIQGLAEAGLIPSALSGNIKDVKFRPDEPLTRAAMILWKVPFDTRQALPTANIDAVKERWGFQDSAKIDPSVARAVLADFNNGDLANIRRVFGFTTLFQPNKSVTRAEAAASLWYFGVQNDGISAKDALQVKPN